MITDFERWLSSQDINEPALDLFTEAILCHKVSAYRAALLLSYLGFQTIIKHRLLAADCPSSLTSKDWTTIQRNLRDDESWDKKVFVCTQMSNSKEIFSLPHDLRKEVEYWKNRRNDCAHSKQNEIGFAHVESFWMFIRSNLGKFVVSGSKAGLIKEIEEHFDIAFTPPEADYSHILAKIPSALETSEMNEFFKEVEEKVKVTFHKPSRRHEIVNFFNDMFSVGSQQKLSNEFIEHLVEFLKSTKDLVYNLLISFPERIMYFSTDTAFIRKLWYKNLLRDFGKNSMPLYCSLLHNELIPTKEIDEAHDTILQRRVSIPETECEFNILNKSGFFKKLKNKVFIDQCISNFDWANKNAAIIAYYLAKFEIDEEVTRSLAYVFSEHNHPYDLKKVLNGFFAEHTCKKAEFLEVLKKESIDTPKYLNL